MLTIVSISVAAIAVVAWFVLVAKRNQRNVQAADDAPVDASVDASVDQEPKPAVWPTDDKIPGIVKWLAECRASEAALRLEFEQYSTADLEAIEEPRFMFRESDGGFRARVTRNQRMAREILAERSGCDHPECEHRLPHPASRPRRWWQAP